MKTKKLKEMIDDNNSKPLFNNRENFDPGLIDYHSLIDPLV